MYNLLLLGPFNKKISNANKRVPSICIFFPNQQERCSWWGCIRHLLAKNAGWVQLSQLQAACPSWWGCTSSSSGTEGHSSLCSQSMCSRPRWGPWGNWQTTFMTTWVWNRVFKLFSLYFYLFFGETLAWWFLEISKVTATTFRSCTNFVWFCSLKCLPNMKVLFKKDSFFPFKYLALVLFISCPASLKDSREESYYIFEKKIVPLPLVFICGRKAVRS